MSEKENDNFPITSEYIPNSSIQVRTESETHIGLEKKKGGS